VAAELSACEAAGAGWDGEVCGVGGASVCAKAIPPRMSKETTTADCKRFINRPPEMLREARKH